MNKLAQLTQTLKRLQRVNPSHQTFKGLEGKKNNIKADQAFSQTLETGHHTLNPLKVQQSLHRTLILGGAMVVLTSIVGYRYYDQPQLGIGTQAPSTIRAPQDSRIEDAQTTQQKRKAAEISITPILKRDNNQTIELRVQVAQILDLITQFRTLAGSYPFVDENVLSVVSQQYLRTASDQQWKALEQQLSSDTDVSASSHPNKTDSPPETLIKELKKQKESLSTQDFQELWGKIATARQKYQKVLEVIPQSLLEPLDESQMLLFLSLTDSQWQKTREKTTESVHRVLTQGIHPGFPPALLQETLEVHLDSAIPKSVRPTLQSLLLNALRNQSNLVTDEEATRLIAQEASAAVEPSVIDIRSGEIIVEQGELITEETFVILDHFDLSQRSINWLGLGITGLLVSGGILLVGWTAKKTHLCLRRRDYLVLSLLSATTPLLTIINASYLNLPMVGVLTSSFYNPPLAMTQVVILGGLSMVTQEKPQWDYLVPGVMGGLLAAFVAGRLRSRDELALLGVGVGGVQFVLYIAYHLGLSAISGGSYLVLGTLLSNGLFYGIAGMIWTVLAIGLSPFLESLFDFITPIRLVELSNLNRPLLKRLQTETPGTFQHTLFVACLAEAAARELNCNVELVRAGTLYHDIGKMHDPLGFIENQMGGPNKHDEINDPWLSMEIIKKHVTEGLVMARQYGLPRMIQDFIPEHQGKLLISYFYYQAKQEAEANGKTIDEEEFRYAGPIPQSRETAIVMLADGCEAALRSLQDATPETASALIKKIFKARWRDNQLQDSGLTYEELPLIADIFVRVWQQFHHKRIAYPQAALEIKPTLKS